MTEREIDHVSGVETTGHAWDGVKELNNPLPRWWLIVFWISVLWSVGYWILMPAWPTPSGFTRGLRNHSERANVERALADVEASRGTTMKRLLTIQSVAEIENNPELLQYTMAAGASLFGDNCATCHGSGGQGFPGYPNLNDDDWLWGGSFDDIKRTIRHGARSGDGEGRIGVMQGFGHDKILTSPQINDLVDYVRSLSGLSSDSDATARAAPLFAQYCSSCHGANGKGMRQFGAPNLTDAIWLHGGDAQTLRETIHAGRAGVMPAWNGRLSEEEVTALAAYVHSLGGGE